MSEIEVMDESIYLRKRERVRHMIYGAIIGLVISLVGTIILLSRYIAFQDERLIYKEYQLNTEMKVEQALLGAITEIAEARKIASEIKPKGDRQ